jgi:hypothetical protein
MYLGDKKSLTLLTQSRIELAAVEVRLVRELLDLVRPPSRSTSYATSRPRTGVLDAACPMSLTIPSSLSLSYFAESLSLIYQPFLRNATQCCEMQTIDKYFAIGLFLFLDCCHSDHRLQRFPPVNSWYSKFFGQ